VQRASADRILWRCRRGMKELDLLLEHFAREHYPHAPQAHRRAFERLLDLPDPRIVELLLDATELPAADPELAGVVALVAAAARR
jgi:antitoxin CptB